MEKNFQGVSMAEQLRPSGGWGCQFFLVAGVLTMKIGTP